jgi:hypothetical protein
MRDEDREALIGYLAANPTAGDLKALVDTYGRRKA